jgi:hypothetical protein
VDALTLLKSFRRLRPGRFRKAPIHGDVASLSSSWTRQGAFGFDQSVRQMPLPLSNSVTKAQRRTQMARILGMGAPIPYCKKSGVNKGAANGCPERRRNGGLAGGCAEFFEKLGKPVFTSRR